MSSWEEMVNRARAQEYVSFDGPYPPFPHFPNHWGAQDGRLIPICELSDDHLGNILRFLQRKAEAERRVNIATVLWHLLPEGPGVDKVPHRTLPDGFLVRENCPSVRPVSSPWQAFVHHKFFALEEEVKQRGLAWKLVPDEQWGVAQDMLILNALSKGSLEFAREGDDNGNRN
jgi:hypothetical protein